MPGWTPDQNSKGGLKRDQQQRWTEARPTAKGTQEHTSKIKQLNALSDSLSQKLLKAGSEKSLSSSKSAGVQKMSRYCVTGAVNFEAYTHSRQTAS
ncbi:hypothetical protein ElyMa_004331400 [Elysia marginata]|uniref:Uncharacterized protein n=1 Tax=Elysia marginata TaxID=1093978 RepID=A0AAV4H283_9GAST|nr:hypothetical protein ElyMa_004331400 [Elysia marginata]